MKPLLITIYVPLCGEHCTFCNRLTTPSTMRMVTDYTHALLTEIASAAELCEGYSVETIRFTGGTPLLLGGTNLATIVLPSTVTAMTNAPRVLTSSILLIIC